MSQLGKGLNTLYCNGGEVMDRPRGCLRCWWVQLTVYSTQNPHSEFYIRPQRPRCFTVRDAPFVNSLTRALSNQDYTVCEFAEIASDLTLEGIMKEWNWLAANLFRVLNEMESDEEVTNFTICKVQSLVTHTNSQRIQEEEPVASASDQAVIKKFKDAFNLPDAERLVNYYSCK